MMGGMETEGEPINISVSAGEDLFCLRDSGQQGTSKALKLAVPKGRETSFRTRAEPTLEKMFSAFCERSELDPRSVMFKMQGGKRLHALDARSSVGLEHGDRLMAYHCKDFVLDPTNRANSVGADLSKMLFNSHLSDVILERERICAHRCILASRTPKFEGLFSGQFSESSAAEVKLPTQESRGFKLLLTYLYTNKVVMPSATAAVMALLVMADEYLCGPLRTLCEEELLARLSLENVCDLFCAGTLHGLQELVDISKRLIVNNFHDLPAESLELLKQKPDLLLEVARSGIRPRKRARTSL